MRGFSVHDLIAAYERGVFPMADAREDDRVFLVDPERRGVLPLDDFRVPRRLARTVRGDPYVIRIDTDFQGVVAACAEATSRRPETWINSGIEGLYCELFRLGHAHSVECWTGEALIGGLYGVSLGGAFFGESMFSKGRDASKVALVHLVARLRFGGYRLLDAQFTNEHLKQFGLREIAREAYHRQLGSALATQGDFQLLPAGTAGGAALQLTSQAS